MQQQNQEHAQLKLELFISCRSLNNNDAFTSCDSYVVLNVLNNKQWTYFDKTETIPKQNNPNFTKTFQLDYFFEVQQHLKFELFDGSKFIGQVETTLSAIAGVKDQVLVLNLLGNNQQVVGKLIVKADQVKINNDEIVMVIKARDITDTRFWFWKSTNPFLRFYRLRKDDSTPVLSYQTEEIINNRNPTWNKIRVKSQKLCNADYNMPIKVELWDYRTSGKHFYLGETAFSVDQLNESAKEMQLQIKDNKQDKVNGILSFNHFQLIPKPTFLDYLQGGVELNLIVAIDFTASNQNPQHPTSLHYLHPDNQLNQYQQAILSVGEILVNYDYDKKIPVYGFGCRPQMQNIRSNHALHCFPLNDNLNDPEVDGLQGIFECYNQGIKQVVFDGPTYFNPIIQESKKLAQICRDQKSQNYFILLILTDGEIHDKQATIDAIIDSSHLPLSIIIVGIGDADFTTMKIIDDDNKSMVSSKGKTSQRDLVQFVPFNQFKHNPELLSQNVLEELPEQLVEYMLLVNQQPGYHNSKMIKFDYLLEINLNNYNNDVQSHNQYHQVSNPMLESMNQSSSTEKQFLQQNLPKLNNRNMGVQILGQGLAEQGFLQQHINQCHAQNFMPQQNHQQQYPYQQFKQSENSFNMVESYKSSNYNRRY